MTVVRKRPARIPGLARHAAVSAMSGTLRRGPERARFEAAISARLDGAAVAAVGSGRFALLMVLDALGVEPGATVLLPAYNASCVPNALQAAGYRLHFVDVRRDTLHLDVDALPDEPPDGAAVVLATHIEGSPAPVDALREWADERGLLVVEDAAHALGATLNGRPVGALADGAIFSLGRGKHLNTLGGGLAVVHDDEAAARLERLAERLPPPPAADVMRAVLMEGVVETGTTPALFSALAAPALRMARRFGRDPMSRLFEDDKSALASVPPQWRQRLSNLQARFGLAALEGFDLGLARRRRIAATLQAALDDVLELQQPIDGADPAWLELTAQVEQRDRFQRLLAERGVDTQRTWMDACDALPAFADAGGGPCEIAREVAARALYLPTYAALTDAEVDHVAVAAREAVREVGA